MDMMMVMVMLNDVGEPSTGSGGGGTIWSM